MPSQIKTVTDKDQFPLLINNFFSKGNIFVKTSSADLEAQFLGYSDDNLALRIPGIKNLPETLILFTRQKGHTLYLSMKYVERNEDTYICLPVKMQIISTERKEDRQVVNAGGGSKNVLYVSNVVSDFFIKHALETNGKKNDKIREVAEYELEKTGFEHIRIVFNYEAVNDARMKHTLNKMTPIFVPNLNSDPEEKYADMFNYYINSIYSRDSQFTGSSKYTAEILVPILHRNTIPYGYIQVNSLSPFTEGQLVVVQRIAIVIDQLFIQQKRFNPVTAKFLVSDISDGGLGLVFNDRALARNFRKDSILTCDIMLPTSKKVVLSAHVRSVTFMDNNIIKVGLQYYQMDDSSKGNLEEFLGIIHKG
jgi:hypothetical protein